MLNIMSSDLFRVRKGKVFLGVTIGAVAVVLLILMIMKIMGSESVYESMMNTPGLVTAGEVDELKEMKTMMPENGAAFLMMMMDEGGSCFALLLLPFIMTVFGGDYSSGIFRNLLSYHSERGKIYISKLLTTLILSLATVLIFAVTSILAGGLGFGFAGFSAGLFFNLFKGTLVMLPVMVAFICLGYCIQAWTKRNSYTIAIYPVGMIVWAMITQFMSMIPGLGWLIQLDLMSVLGSLFTYQTLTAGQIIVPLAFSAILIVLSLGLGIYKYKTTDFDFS